MKATNIAKVVIALAALALASGCGPIRRDYKSFHHDGPGTVTYMRYQKKVREHRNPHTMTPYPIRKSYKKK